MCNRCGAADAKICRGLCRRCYRKQWYAKNSEHHKKMNNLARAKREPHDRVMERQYRLQKLYRMSLAEFQQLADAQNGVCAICFTAPIDGPLCVDHDHITGARRKLLCRHCNLVIGNASDNIQTLLSAVAYLKAHKQMAR